MTVQAEWIKRHLCSSSCSIPNIHSTAAVVVVVVDRSRVRELIEVLAVRKGVPYERVEFGVIRRRALLLLLAVLPRVDARAVRRRANIIIFRPSTPCSSGPGGWPSLSCSYSSFGPYSSLELYEYSRGLMGLLLASSSSCIPAAGCCACLPL